MKKVVAMVIGIVVALGAFEASAGLNNYQQKVFYRCWSNNCLQLLLDAKWKEYMPCSKGCYAQAQAATQGWCNDSDGVNFETIGVVTTDTNPAGVTDYCLDLFGTTYVIEGACSASNLYYWYYKDCAEYSAKHYCLGGACEYVNNPPELMVVANSYEASEGEPYEIYLSALDEDGDNLSFFVENLPAGAVLDDTYVPVGPVWGTHHAAFYWTPNFQQAGEYEVKFGVGDGESEDGQTVKITVVDVPKGWVKFFPDVFGPYEANKIGFSIEATDDDGYVVTGETVAINNLTMALPDLYVKKVNKKGGKAWNKIFGKPEFDEWGRSISKAGDGGYIITGGIQQEPKTLPNAVSPSDLWLLKVDGDGNLQWEKTFGEPGALLWEEGRSVIPATDSGYIIAGYKTTINAEGNTITVAWIIKVDALGDKIWDKTYEVPLGVGGKIIPAEDDGYVFTGCGSFKIDSVGSVVWKSNNGGNSIVGAQGHDGYLICGGAHITKVDLEGNLVWDKLFTNADWHDIKKTKDGGYIIVGTVQGGAYDDVWMMKVAGNGETEWEKKYNGNNILGIGQGDWNDDGFSVVQASDGGYAITGFSTQACLWPIGYCYYVFIMKTDENGDIF